jgi:predicted house-cleaning noncanonical NTP pyrophosphatase (MazG superfamily)
MGEPYEKLVRDGIPEKLDQKGISYKKRIATDTEYKTELIKKLLEEAQEFAADESVEELADVLEVIDALKTLPEYQTVLTEQEKKCSERGGFKERFILKGEKD